MNNLDRDLWYHSCNKCGKVYGIYAFEKYWAAEENRLCEDCCGKYKSEKYKSDLK
jgi:hypothetical protein